MPSPRPRRLLSAANSPDGLLDAEQRAEHATNIARTQAVLAADSLNAVTIGEFARRTSHPVFAAELARGALALPNDRTALNSNLIVHLLDPHIHRPTRIHRLAIAFGASARCMPGRGYFQENKMHDAALAGSIPARCVYAALGEPIAPWCAEGEPVRAAMALRELVLIFRDGITR